jgi:hypothetical protein
MIDIKNLRLGVNAGVDLAYVSGGSNRLGNSISSIAFGKHRLPLQV